MIRRLAAEGLPNTKIAERLGISRGTVIKAVASARIVEGDIFGEALCDV